MTIRPQRFQVVQVGDAARLFISAALDEWAPLEESGIEAAIDLDGGLDPWIPTLSNRPRMV